MRVLKLKLGITSPHRIWDARFMIALVEEAVRRRFHVDVIPLDWSSVFHEIRPDSAWQARRMFDGTDALFPPDTRIGVEPDGSWVLLDERGVPTASECRKTATTSMTRPSTRGRHPS